MPKATFDRLSVRHDDICSIFSKEIFNMSKALDSPNRFAKKCDLADSVIEVSSSHSIPLPDQSVYAVVSSPPYCTRIDYAIATKPELALLGCPIDNELKKLRDLMIGTPTILKFQARIDPNWGEECLSFLEKVINHRSKASKSYYSKYYIQYFDSIYRSFLEIDRILIESGYCTLVVQDSYYKDIHNDLALIFTQMGKSIIVKNLTIET